MKKIPLSRRTYKNSQEANLHRSLNFVQLQEQLILPVNHKFLPIFETNHLSMDDNISSQQDYFQSFNTQKLECLL